MTTTKTEPTTGDVLEGFAIAIAKANGHPDPAAFAAEVKKHLEKPQAKSAAQVAAEARAEVKAEDEAKP